MEDEMLTLHKYNYALVLGTKVKFQDVDHKTDICTHKGKAKGEQW